MRDFQFWIYLILGVIYLISRARKKSQAETTDVPKPQNERRFEGSQEPKASTPKGLTFEELLREITEAKVEVKPVVPKFQPKKYVDYDDDLEEEEQSLEDVKGDYTKKDKEFYNTYEQAKKQAFNRPSLEETVKLKDTNMKFGKFNVFDEEVEKNYLNDYLKELKDPDGFKKAFVLSEVLQRRY